MTTIVMGLQQTVLELIRTTQNLHLHTFATDSNRGQKAGHPLKPHLVLWIIMAWLAKLHLHVSDDWRQTKNPPNIFQTRNNGDETYSRKVQPSSTKSNPGQLYQLY